MDTFWFRCPVCKHAGSIDSDQAEGRVSIDHTPDGCSFHETVRVRPLIPDTEPLLARVAFALEKL